MPEIVTFRPKVMVINFRPAAIPAEWNLSEALIPQYIETMRQLSGSQLVYQVVKKLDVAQYPLLTGGRQYDDANWFKAWKDSSQAYYDDQHRLLMTDYPHLIQEFNLVQEVQNQQIDEVWLFGGPYFGFYESCMVGRGAFDSNGAPIEQNCRRFIIMGFNYEREVKEMVHDYGHRAERILAEQYGSRLFLDLLYQLRPLPPVANAYEQFLLKNGTVHRKPGGEEYQQDVPTWLTAMQPAWWPPTIDPNQLQPWWFKIKARLSYTFSAR